MLVADQARGRGEDLGATGHRLAVRDDGDRRGIEALVIGVQDHVGIEPVGESPDDLAAILLVGLATSGEAGKFRAQREIVDVAAFGAAGEIVTQPHRALVGADFVTFHETIGVGDPALGESGAKRLAYGEVRGHVDLKLGLQALEVRRQVEDQVVKLSAGCIGGEPVGAHHAGFRPRHRGKGFGAGPGEGVGIKSGDLFPERRRPVDRIQIDSEIDSLRSHPLEGGHAGVGGKAVEELGHALAHPVERFFGDRGVVVHGREGEVADPFAHALWKPEEVL